jgi:hypothetical protein
VTSNDVGFFCGKLVTLAALFKDRLTEDVQELYFKLLSDLPLDAVIAALDAAGRTCTFMPKPAEIRALVQAPGGDPELAVESAWVEFKRLAKDVGGYRTPTFTDHALADAIVDVFGSWTRACFSDFSPEMWASKRKEFSRCYRMRLEEPRKAGEITHKLIGFCERENAPLLEQKQLPSEAGETLISIHDAVQQIRANVAADAEGRRAERRRNVQQTLRDHADAVSPERYEQARRVFTEADAQAALRLAALREASEKSSDRQRPRLVQRRATKGQADGRTS